MSKILYVSFLTTVMFRLTIEDVSASSPFGGNPSFYDAGSPDAHEQLLLELVNRARANPPAEAARFGIDLNEGLAAGTISPDAKPPLAMHPRLVEAARAHSAWMLENDTFSHTGEDGSTVSQRIAASGYVLSAPYATGENLSWGGTSGVIDVDLSTPARHRALFLSPGHRVNICSPDFDEVGHGLLLGVFHSGGTDWNAQMFTAKFARSKATPSPFLVGVAYYDFNGNGSYDPGEGIGGVRIDVEGGSWFNETGLAGGYAVPVPEPQGTRRIAFSGPSLLVTRDVAFPGNVNFKEDLALTYHPPVVTGEPTPAAGKPSAYLTTSVPGATAMRYQVSRFIPAMNDQAESLDRVETRTSPGYTPLSTTVRAQGAASYRLAHPLIEGHETLTYPHPFVPGPGAKMTFRSRLGFATAHQVASVQISDDGGHSWTTRYQQAGTGNSGESSFHIRSIDLSDHNGSSLMIRFSYRHHSGGGYFYQTSDGVGWYVDDIVFDDMQVLDALGEETIADGDMFVFTPPEPGNYSISATPLHAGGTWPSGPMMLLHAMDVESPSVAGYEMWAADFEGYLGLSPGSIADDPEGIMNGTGVSNLIVYAMGLDPGSLHVPHAPVLRATDGRMHFEYRRSPMRSDVTLVPEISFDLRDWHEPGGENCPAASYEESEEIEPGIEMRRVCIPVSAGAERVFFRLRATTQSD